MATASPAACQRQLTATALLVATVCACVTLTVLILLLERAGSLSSRHSLGTISEGTRPKYGTNPHLNVPTCMTATKE